jgi:Domain of unknown function (DUF1707)
MTDVSQEQTALEPRAVRASDSERDQVAAQLQRHFGEGRLSLAELEERVGEAYAAKTREQLRALTADLPADAGPRRDPRAQCGPEPWLLCLLLWVCPPAGIVYWLLSRRSPRKPADRGDHVEVTAGSR